MRLDMVYLRVERRVREFRRLELAIILYGSSTGHTPVKVPRVSRDISASLWYSRVNGRRLNDM